MDHDHLPALTALMFAAPFAVLALALLRPSLDRRTLADQVVALGLFIAGVIHLGLIPGHADEPWLAASFAVAGAAMVTLAFAALTTSWWRMPAAACLVSVPAAYVATRLAGLEGIDVLGLATCGIEVLALTLLVTRTRFRPSISL